MKNKVIRSTVEPTQKEIDEHENMHLEFRSGCGPCVDGKAKEDQHRRIELEEEERLAKTPVLELDYFFLEDMEYMVTHGHPDPSEEVTVLNLICKNSGSGGCTKVRQKGSGDPYAVEFVFQSVQQMGWARL